MDERGIKEELGDIKGTLAEIRNDIMYSVAPKFLEIAPSTDDLVELAIDLWRMERRLGKFLSGLPAEQQESLNNSMSRLKRYLEKNDIEVVDHTGEKYDEGQNLEILAVEKDAKAAKPTIKETKEPTIMYKGQVIHLGKVIIASKEDQTEEE